MTGTLVKLRVDKGGRPTGEEVSEIGLRCGAAGEESNLGIRPRAEMQIVQGWAVGGRK